MDEKKRAVVSAEDCAKAWDELAPEQRAWIEDRRMYWADRDSEGRVMGVKSAADVWPTLSTEQRIRDIEAMDRPVVDALKDRVLQRTVSNAINGNRAWAVEARSFLGPPSQASDMREYAAKAVAFLENQARLYQRSEPSEASAIRAAAAAIRKVLPKASLHGRHAERQFRDGFNDIKQARVSAPVSDQSRIAELAAMEKLSVRHWIEITGVGVGPHESFEVAEEAVSFRKWDFDFIKQSPHDWQIEMLAENETPPLIFPCTPRELVDFVRNAPGVHNFRLPEGFEGSIVEKPDRGLEKKRAVLPSQQHQDLLLATMKELGWDPKNLPAQAIGRPGNLSALKKELVPKLMTESQLKHAWDAFKADMKSKRAL